MKQETTTTTEEYLNYVAYAYLDGELFMDQRYFKKLNENSEDSV